MLLLAEDIMKQIDRRYPEHTNEHKAQLSIVILKHVYYKHDSLNPKKENLERDQKKRFFTVENSQKFVDEQVKIVLRGVLEGDQSESKWKAVLHQIYHHAIHN